MKHIVRVIVLALLLAGLLAACGGDDEDSDKVKRGSAVQVAQETIKYMEKQDIGKLKELRCDPDQSVGERDDSVTYDFGDMTYTEEPYTAGWGEVVAVQMNDDGTVPTLAPTEPPEVLGSVVYVEGPVKVEEDGEVVFDDIVRWTFIILKDGDKWCNDFDEADSYVPDDEGDAPAMAPPIPEVTILEPAEGAVFDLGATVSVNVRATTANSNITRVELLVDGVQVADHQPDDSALSDTLEVVLDYTPARAGTITLSVRAYNNIGVDSYPAERTITIIPNE